MAHVLAIAPDLFFASKIDATLKSAGHEVTIVSRIEAQWPDGTDVVIVDLDNTDIGSGLPPGTPTIGFYSHVDVDTKRRAEEAGLDLVVPRSRMAREMPALVESLVAEL